MWGCTSLLLIPIHPPSYPHVSTFTHPGALLALSTLHPIADHSPRALLSPSLYHLLRLYTPSIHVYVRVLV